MGQYEFTVELRMLWAPPRGNPTVSEAILSWRPAWSSISEVGSLKELETSSTPKLMIQVDALHVAMQVFASYQSAIQACIYQY